MMTSAQTSKSFLPDVADSSDDEQLRKLLRDNPMAGRISLSLEREPSFFLGATIEGENHHTVIVRKEDKLVGLGTRCSRKAWIDGQEQNLGYLSQLRMDSGIKSPGALRAGFKKIRELHDRGDCKFYVTTIIEDNLLARRLLERDWRDKPVYEKRGVLSTLVLPLGRRRSAARPEGVEIRKGGAQDLEEIASCLRRTYARYQFAPVWSAQMLTDEDLVRGLRPEHFIVATRRGKTVGVCALWDQSGFKQSVVRGYSQNLGRFRRLLNLAKPFTGLPYFPPVGGEFRHLYVSHLAVDDNDEEVFLSLLVKAYDLSSARGYSYLTFGLCEGNPLLKMVRDRFSPMEYRSIIYLVYYKEDAVSARQIKHKTPHLEIAVL